MCLDPLSAGILSAGVSLMQTVMGYAAQSEQYAENARLAKEQNDIDQQQLTLRQVQEGRAKALAKQEQNIQEAEVKASLQVAQSAKGASSGATYDLLQADVSRRADRNRTTLDENTRMVVTQLQTEKKAATVRAKSRIASVAKPNPLSLVAGIGSAALGGYNTYQKYMS